MPAKVLVVDDDVVSRMLLMHLVDAHGSYEVIEAEDGEDARAQLDGGLRPVVVFCDLRMPRMSGLDLLRHMQASEELRQVPLVLVTSATDRDTMEKASDFGAAGYLVKPFMPEQVGWFLPRAADTGEAADGHAEPPLETMQRLGINSDRLLAYLGGLGSQITGGRAEMGALYANGDIEGVQARLERLRTGCITLGLLGAAESLQACRSAAFARDEVEAALARAERAVGRQAGLAQRVSAS